MQNSLTTHTHTHTSVSAFILSTLHHTEQRDRRQSGQIWSSAVHSGQMADNCLNRYFSLRAGGCTTGLSQRLPALRRTLRAVGCQDTMPTLLEWPSNTTTGSERGVSSPFSGICQTWIRFTYQTQIKSQRKKICPLLLFTALLLKSRLQKYSRFRLCVDADDMTKKQSVLLCLTNVDESSLTVLYVHRQPTFSPGNSTLTKSRLRKNSTN